jgi:hypothetical protein
MERMKELLGGFDDNVFDEWVGAKWTLDNVLHSDFLL